MAGINYKSFKKISSDNEHTILEHANGHELRIAHSKLSPKMKQDLDRLPIHKAQGGPVKMYADPDGAVSQDDSAPTQPQMPNININLGGVGQQQPPSNGVPAALAPNGAPGTQDPSQYKGTSSVKVNSPQGASDDFSEPEQSKLAEAQPKPQVAPQPQANMPAYDPSPSDADTSGQGLAGMAVTQPAGIGQVLTTPMPAGNIRQSLDQEYAQAKNDYLTHNITPETYKSLYADKSTLGKIGSVFGLILGGVGSGLTHQPNAALEMMNKIIDRDLESQKNNQANRMNFLTAVNQHHATESQIALQGAQAGEAQANQGLIKANTNLANMNVTKTHALLGALGFLNDNVSNLPPGQVKTNGQQALQGVSNAIDQHVQQMNGQTAAQIEGNWQRKNSLMNMLDPQIAKYDSEHHIPGVAGQTSLPIDEKTRSQYLELNNFNSAVKDANDFLGKSGKLGPITPQMRAQGTGIQNRLELEIGKLEGLGRFTPEEAKHYKQMIPDLTGTHFTGADNARVNNLQNEINEHIKNINQTYGAPASGGEGSSSGPKEGATQLSKSGKPMVYKNGGWKYK